MNVKPCTGKVLTISNTDHLLTIEIATLDSHTMLLRAKLTGTLGRDASLLIEKETNSDIVHRSIAKGNIQLVAALYDYIDSPHKYY